MRPQIIATDIITNVESKEFSINFSKEQVAHFTRLLVTSQYVDPPKAALREIISNAYDANLEADNLETPIEIHQTFNTVSVRDYGSGLSPDKINDFYTVIGASSKRESDNQIGAYGIGRLAPLAVNSKFQVSSFYNGYEYKYTVYLNKEGIPAITHWETKTTEERNGLKVTLLMAHLNFGYVGNLIKELILGSRYQIKYSNDNDNPTNLFEYNKFLLDSFKIKHEEQEYIVDLFEFSLKSDRIISIVYDLGGVLYRCESLESVKRQVDLRVESFIHKWLEERRNVPGSLYCTAIIRLNPDSLTLTSSREELSKSQQNQIKISELAKIVYKTACNRIKRLVRLDIKENLPDLLELYSENRQRVLIQVLTTLNKCVKQAYGNSVIGKLNFDIGFPKPIQADFSGSGLLTIDIEKAIKDKENKFYYFHCNDRPIGFLPIRSTEDPTIREFIWKAKDKDDYAPEEETEDPLILKERIKEHKIHLYVTQQCEGTIYNRRRNKPFYFPLIDILDLRIPVITKTPDQSLTIRSFQQTTGINPKKSHVLVIEQHKWHIGRLNEILEKYVGVIDYKGIYSPEVEEPKRKNKVSIEAEYDVKNTLSLVKRFSWVSKGAYNTNSDQFYLDKVDESTLKKKVVYHKRTGEGSPIISLVSCPTEYRLDYEDYGLYLTEVAEKKIESLIQAKLCNWVHIDKAYKELKTNLIKRLGFGSYIGQFKNFYYRLDLLKNLGFGKYIPESSLAILDYSEELKTYLTSVSKVDSGEVLRKFYPTHDLATRNVYLYCEPYYNQRLDDLVYGPILVEHIDYIMQILGRYIGDNYPANVEEVTREKGVRYLKILLRELVQLPTEKSGDCSAQTE